jgi:hypothetical protein
MQEDYKGYIIRPHPQNPKCYIVTLSGRGGKAPECLSGMFTSSGIIKGIIDRYLDGKKAIEDAKKVSKVGV